MIASSVEPTASTFTAVLAAMSRLNSWVRSPAGRWSDLKKVIYLLKREAIVEAHRRGLATHRLVYVDVRCRDCGGTGRYCEELDHCWACENTGTARLRFVETQIAEGPTWHSPRQRFSLWPHANGQELLDGLEPVAATDWTVNQPGQDLEVWELARDLELVERTYPAHPWERAWWWCVEVGR